MDSATLGAAVAIAKKNAVDPAVIEGAVADWLDDHPEATTTVQDGSITKAKLDSNLQGTVDEVVDLKSVFGHPDIAFIGKKIAVFCDSEFWHGYDWEHRKNDIKTRREFWIPKIERNIQRDIEVTEQLQNDGWIVLRFWGKEIKADVHQCAALVKSTIESRSLNTKKGRIRGKHDLQND